MFVSIQQEPVCAIFMTAMRNSALYNMIFLASSPLRLRFPYVKTVLQKGRRACCPHSSAMQQPFTAEPISIHSEVKSILPCRLPLCILGDLPLELAVAIIGMAAPKVWQQSTCKHREGRLDLAPVRVPASLTPSEKVRPLVGGAK